MVTNDAALRGLSVSGDGGNVGDEGSDGEDGPVSGEGAGVNSVDGLPEIVL